MKTPLPGKEKKMAENGNTTIQKTIKAKSKSSISSGEKLLKKKAPNYENSCKWTNGETRKLKADWRHALERGPT